MEKPNEFRSFDVVLDDSDHRFRVDNQDGGGGDSFTNTNCEVYKRIMREWKMLEQSLPESIYVRAYERRIDLLRAAIVGAAGTPYHDGLFFFDIAFPADYPTHPPRLHFHSFGLRLNPNLYENGMVCLSLLNTWIGQKSELWDPSRSTVLQVLLSLQGLVLNQDPLFNEPSYAALSRSRSLLDGKSREYDEYVFALTCYASIYLIRKPPKHFEPFVRAHFRERAGAILAACKEYVNGRVRVGYYCCVDNTAGSSPSSSSSTTVEVSAVFEEWVRSFYRKLFEAFKQCGASLAPSMKRLELQRKRSESNSGTGIFKKAMAKIKQALGWKNIGKKKMASAVEFQGIDLGHQTTLIT